MRVKEFKSGYLVILKDWWCRYGKNAFVDRACATMEEAEYVRESLKKNDRKEFIIYEVHTN